jgi:hypothetical protein
VTSEVSRIIYSFKMANNYNQDKDKEPEIEFAILWEDFIQNTGFHGVNKLSSASKSRKLRM